MKKEAIVQKNPKSPISETFRMLRTNIQFMNTNKKMKSLLVTSTFPGEGKSWVTANLAITFAQAGKKVILVDADMRKGRQYAIFEVSPKPGLSNYLSKVGMDDSGKTSEDLNDYIKETEIKNLYIMPAGIVPPNPSELLVSSQMVDLLETLKELCDIVIVDGTPCEILTDSVILSKIVDTTIVVTAYKKTKKDLLNRTIKSIQNVDGNIAGVVLNRIPAKMNDQYYYQASNKKGNSKNIVKIINNILEKKLKNKENKNLKDKSIEIKENDNKRNSITKKQNDKKDKNYNNNSKNKNKKKSNDTNNGKNNKKDNNTKEKTNNVENQKKSNNSEEQIVLDKKSIEILQQINEYLENNKKKKQN